MLKFSSLSALKNFLKLQNLAENDFIVHVLLGPLLQQEAIFTFFKKERSKILFLYLYLLSLTVVSAEVEMNV